MAVLQLRDGGSAADTRLAGGNELSRKMKKKAKSKKAPAPLSTTSAKTPPLDPKQKSEPASAAASQGLPPTAKSTKLAPTSPTPSKAKAQPPGKSSSVLTPEPRPKVKKPIKRTVSPRSTGKKVDLKIPPILLEGDHSPSLPVSGPGARYALAAQPVRAGELPSPGELPQAYGTGRLFLAARDPHWVYASWDFTDEQQREWNSRSRDGHLVLRVFAHGENRPAVPEVHVHPESRNWFVNVSRPETRFHAEIGFYSASGAWKSVAVSQSTFTPPAEPSTDLRAEFATIPIEVTFQRVVEMVQEFVTESKPLLEAVAEAQKQEEGKEQPPQFEAKREGATSKVAARATGGISETKPPRAARALKHSHVEIKPGREWTPAQAESLKRLIHIDGYRRVWMGSMEITELVRRQLEEEIGSIAAAEAKRIAFGEQKDFVPPGVNVSSEFGGEFPRARKFWFKVNAELIIYGATEPDAKVSIADRPIKLRSDGTFSFRFSLPDGRFQLPALAVSGDGVDAREARLEFSRSTKFCGEVEAHPQDGSLRPPRPEHLR